MTYEEIADIIEKIKGLPDPGDLSKVITAVQESNNTLNLDEAKDSLLIKYLQKLPYKEGVIIDHIKLNCSMECPECGESINKGYFKIKRIVLSSNIPPTITEREPKIFLSYEVLHNMEIHGIYDNHNCATNENFRELVNESLQKNPRDQVNQQELESQVKKYSIEELKNTLNDLMK